jgi:hypothetical protein
MQDRNEESRMKAETAALGRRWAIRILIFGVALILPPFVTAYSSAQNATVGVSGIHDSILLFLIAMSPFFVHACFSWLYCTSNLEKQLRSTDAIRVIVLGFLGMIFPMIYLWISAQVFFLQHLEVAAPGEPKMGIVFYCYFYSFGLGLLGILTGHWLRTSC